MLWILIGVAITALSYLLFMRPFKYWTERGVVQGKPVPLFGNNLATFFRLQSQPEFSQKLYEINPNGRYSGIYEFSQPVLLLRDPDLIKQITVKDFDHFVDHRSFFPEDIEPLFAKNLFFLSGQKWKDMRSRVSPTFTSSKMKNMFSLISENGEQFVQYFLKQNNDIITVEMKDILTRFTSDVIANVAFGVESDSLRQPENEFLIMGKEATNFSGLRQTFTILGYILIPRISKMLKLTFFSKEVSLFFNKLVKDNITSREKLGIVRPDLINLLMEARKHGLQYEESHDVQDTGFATVQESDIGKSHKVIKTEITDEDMTAQAIIFFLGGFDALTSLMCFMSYELGVNQDVQEKLRREIDKTSENCNGKLTYEALMGMKYLDMVTSETLRMWPNATAIDRKCTKPYTIQPKDPTEKPIYLKEGDRVLLPIYGLQRDSQYFPDPDRFDPERFSDENKHKIKPYTYIPFGSGPRNCIGSRFALLETKTLFFYLLSHFEIVPIEKTQIPLILSKKAATTQAEGGFWFGLKKRVK